MGGSVMRIPLRELPQGHTSIDRVESSEGLDLADWFVVRDPIRVELDADRRNQQVTLRGTVRAQAEHDCDRCLRRFRSEITAPFLILADRRGSDELRDEVALEQEGSVLYHDGVELDLDAPLREALILEVPQVMLCRPDCRGLCPVCGQDLNQKTCDCSPSRGDPRWAALDRLKDPEPGPDR
jgi:uncharacterized protein